MFRQAALAAAAFVAMEPVAYAAHRWVMHGPGWALHASHHAGSPPGPPGGARGGAPGVVRARRPEANDAYPVAFAGLTVAAMAAGNRWPRWSALLPIGVGVTAYGAAYAAVHDGLIHRRLGVRSAGSAGSGLGGYLRAAHATHHRHGGEPYGMLVPIGWPRRAHPHESTAGGQRYA